ncbi:YceI family protein [Thermobaculum terrenum ATCC BAA-798]|uniref:YceI family protein n=1 Tax=Thermobaculum terrenum (strain ATCC BAA-798 / CCMEE 7001 / YNP1) TaxID=525904 RepID=D1CBM4_THET1|nr:YceI family protein [Thermobaculum terrenum]ACZ42189.1 YceI family protein [Thermobaculum terrenum ATCC BAA-798]
MLIETGAKVRTAWVIDSAHSVIEFSVRHMVVSTVKGYFRRFEGIIHADEDQPENSQVEAKIEASSIDTGDSKRDEHLRSDDFFNTESFPYISFSSTKIERTSENTADVHGNLTIRDVTLPVVLHTTFEGQLIDAYGKQRAAFSAETEINRKDYGLRWNALLESGQAVVSDKVKITLHIAAVKSE